MSRRESANQPGGETAEPKDLAPVAVGDNTEYRELGPDGLVPEDDSGEEHAREIVSAAVVVTGGDRAKVLEAAQSALDDVVPVVRFGVERRGASPVSALASRVVPNR